MIRIKVENVKVRKAKGKGRMNIRVTEIGHAGDLYDIYFSDGTVETGLTIEQIRGLVGDLREDASLLRRFALAHAIDLSPGGGGFNVEAILGKTVTLNTAAVGFQVSIL